MLHEETILPAAEASAASLLEQLVDIAAADLAFLYYYHLDHFTLVMCRPGEETRTEVLPHFEEKTGEAAEAYFRQFAAAILQVPANQLALHMTRSISPAHGFANGAIGVSRRRTCDRDAMLQEMISAASYLFGHLLRSLGELNIETSSDEKGSELGLLRTLDAISLMLGARILSAQITETSVGRQRLVTLLLLLITLSTCSRDATEPLLVAIRTADKTIAVELELAAADSGRVMSLIGKESSPIRAVVAALRASIGFSSAFGGRTAAITISAR